MIFTGSYALYQVVCLPVNFSGRGFDLAAHQALIEAWDPPRLSGRGHFPADLRRADRDAAQHVDGGLRAAGGVPGAGSGVCPRRRALGRGPGPGRVARPGLHPAARPAGAQEERQPALRVRPDQQRVHRHPGRRLRAAARLPGRDPAVHGRPPPGHRADPPVLPGEPRAVLARERGRLGPGGVLPGDPGRPATGSAPPSASGRPRSTAGPRWSRRGAQRSSPTPRTCTPASTSCGTAGPSPTCRSSCPPGSARQPGRVRAPAVPLVRRERRASCAHAGCGRSR